VPNQSDVRRIALGLPGTGEDPNGFRFFVAGKQFAWAWMERPDPKRARVASRDAIAVSVAGESEKEILIEMDPRVFFTEPHYVGFPAILVRLPPIDPVTLEKVLTDAWRCRAPKGLAVAGSGRERPA
jgi:hypothetical protein